MLCDEKRGQPAILERENRTNRSGIGTDRAAEMNECMNEFGDDLSFGNIDECRRGGWRRGGGGRRRQ